MVLGDPVSGERLLGVEELLDVVQDQVLQRPADERDEHLADAGEPQLAAGIGFGEEVPAAEVAGAVRDAGAVAALGPFLLVWSYGSKCCSRVMTMSAGITVRAIGGRYMRGRSCLKTMSVPVVARR